MLTFLKKTPCNLLINRNPLIRAFSNPVTLIEDIRYPRKAPVTRQKGFKGKSKSTSVRVNQKRSSRSLWVNYLTSSRFFQKNPAVLYSIKTS